MVYFIRQGRTGAIKIGYTDGDVNKRVSALQTASPDRLILLGYIEGDRNTEKRLHLFFDAYKLNGEWYEPSRFVMDYILGTILKKPISHIYLGLKGKLKEQIELFEKEIIKQALIKFSGNKNRTAKKLGLTRPTLYSKIKKYEISV